MATGSWGGALSQRVFRVKLHWESQLQKCQTGFHLRDVGLNTLNPQDVAEHVAEWANTSFRTILYGTDRLVSVDAENLVTREGHLVTFGNAMGAQGNNQLPPFLTVPVSIKGTLRRRYGSGRMLWPVVQQQQLAAGQLSQFGVGVIEPVVTALADRYIGSSLTHSMRLVHLHPFLPAKGTRPDVAAAWYDATSLRMGRIVGSLDRRKIGAGS